MHSHRTVFVSATTLGFRWWRERIAEILHHQEIEPLEQTFSTPESEIVQRLIEQKISASTGVICLVGPYYGFALGKPHPDGSPRPSYTQYEWALATKYNKPRKVYLVDEEFFQDTGIVSEVDPFQPESVEYRVWQRNFQQTIRDGVDRYPQLRISTPLDLAISLAKINWREWPQ